MTQVAAGRAKLVRADFDEVVGPVSFAAKPYAVLDDPVFFFLAGEGDFHTFRLLFTFLENLCHCCW